MKQSEICYALAEQHAQIQQALDRLLIASDPVKGLQCLHELYALMVKHRSFEADILVPGVRHDAALKIVAEQSISEMASLVTDLSAMIRDYPSPRRLTESKSSYAKDLKSLGDKLRAHILKQDNAVLPKLDYVAK